MSAGRLATLAFCALLSAPAHPAAAERDSRERRPELEVTAPAVSFSKSQLTLTVAQHGALAGRNLALFVFVDGNLIRDFPTQADRTKLVIEPLELAAGSHELLVKSGTYEVRARFRYVPPLVLATAAAAAALILVGVARARRRRRSG